jgi:ribosome-binding factor A
VLNHRAQKMASMIRGEVARLLLTEISDPRLRHLVITDVELSKDLRHAKVFYEGSPTMDLKEVTRGLSKAVVFFRRKIGSNLDLKFVPELSFEADEHAGRLNRILSVLEENKMEQPNE